MPEGGQYTPLAVDVCPVLMRAALGVVPGVTRSEGKVANEGSLMDDEQAVDNTINEGVIVAKRDVDDSAAIY